MRIAGIILIGVGIFMLGYRGLTYNKTAKVTSIDHAGMVDNHEVTMDWPEYTGAFAMAVGVFLLIGRKKMDEKY